MAERTEIGWCDCTHNHWIGCSKISRGCRFCYAEAQERRWNPADDRRRASTWGRTAPRRLTSVANRRKPHQWNRLAAAAGTRPRVFASSLADVFEDHWMLPPMRADLFRTIEETPFLRWMLLTKRIELVAEMTAQVWGTDWPANVLLGTSVEGQAEADARLPILLNLKGPAERFVSAEPVLEHTGIAGHLASARYPLSLLIVGGESGAKARPMHPQWARDLVDEGEAADVPVFFKQWGQFTPYMPTVADPSRPDGFAPDWDRTPSLWVERHTAKVVKREADVPDSGDWQALWRVGKTAAGRDLDGFVYDGVVRSWAQETGLDAPVRWKPGLKAVAGR